MRIEKINEKLTIGMIGIFMPILPLSLVGILLPQVGYVIGILLMLLLVITTLTILLSTYLFIKNFNTVLETLIKNEYERRE